MDRFLSGEDGQPDPAIYQLLMERYCNGRSPAFFTDDIPEYVAGARRLGWRAEIFIDAHRLREQVKKIRA